MNKNKSFPWVLHILFVLLVLPSILYVIVNGYWWLFDGNVINSGKMNAAFGVSLMGSFVYAFVLWIYISVVRNGRRY